jgi:membrane protease YdiL (CAAX protease family)
MRKLAVRSCSPLQWVLVLLLIVPQSVFASQLANAVNEVLRWVDNPFLNLFNDSSWVYGFAQLPWPLVFIGGCLFPALGEELFFRGVLSRGLVAWHGVAVGSIIASVLFGLIHLAPAQALATIVIGLVLQFVFLTTRSLLAPILVHLLNNSMAFLMVHHGMLFPVPGYTDERFHHVPLLVVLAALGLTAAILALLYQTRTRWQLPDGSQWQPGFFPTEAPPRELAARGVNRAPSVLLTIVAVLALAAFAAALYAFQSPPAPLPQ